MNGIRKILLVFCCLGLAIVSAPSVAASNNGTPKSFGLLMTANPEYVVDPVTLTSSVKAPVTVTARVTNLSPPADAASNASSFVLNLVVPGVTIDSVDPTGVITDSKGNVINASTGVVQKISATQIQVTAMGPLKGQQTFTATFRVTSCGDAKWDATVYTGSQLTGQTFQRLGDTAGQANLFTIVSCGSVTCGDGFSVADTTGLSKNPFLFGTHGTYNEDGTCGSVSYFVSNFLVTSQNIHIRWPRSGAGAQPNAAFVYSVVVNSPSTPLVGWKNPNGTLANAGDGTANPVYIPPMLCSTDQLPAPYGALQQQTDASSSANQLKVNTSQNSGAVLPVPTTFPFPIVIGAERMNVLSIQGSTWTVSRPIGDTLVDSHKAGALVMSTPLSLLSGTPSTGLLKDGVTQVNSPYHDGDVARVCLAEGPINNNDGTYTSTFIDINDGWVQVPR